jgi:hypothetical protein
MATLLEMGIAAVYHREIKMRQQIGRDHRHSRISERKEKSMMQKSK